MVLIHYSKILSIVFKPEGFLVQHKEFHYLTLSKMNSVRCFVSVATIMAFSIKYSSHSIKFYRRIRSKHI